VSKLRIFLRIVIPLGLAAFITLMLMVIYPRSMTFGAAWLCPEDRPDPFIVSETYQTDDGTSTSSSLFCMGERGEFVEIGLWDPFKYLFVFVYALTLGAFAFFWISGALRRRRLRPPPSVTDAPAAPDPLAEALAQQQGPIID
jgi:hypothetical protein